MEFTGKGAGTVTGVTPGDASITVGGTAAAPTVAVSQSFAFAWTAAQSWTVDDANRATNTDIFTLTHSTNDPLFGAAGMSAGILFRLEDDAGLATAEAGRLGFEWVDASAASLDSAFFVQLRRANAALAVDHFRVTGTQLTATLEGGTLSGNSGIADMATNGSNGLFYVKANNSAAYGGFVGLNDDAGGNAFGLFGVGGSTIAGNRIGVPIASTCLALSFGTPMAIGTQSTYSLTLSTNDTARWQVGASTGDLTPFLNDTYDIGTSALRVMDIWTGGRMHHSKGSDVTAANDMTLGAGGISFDITGATQINTIASTTWQAGDLVALQFDSTPTVKHATAGTGAQLALAGSFDFVASAGDTLVLWYDGTVWRELARTVI